MLPILHDKLRFCITEKWRSWVTCMTDLRVMPDKHDKNALFQETQTFLHLISITVGKFDFELQIGSLPADCGREEPFSETSGEDSNPSSGNRSELLDSFKSDSMFALAVLEQ